VEILLCCANLSDLSDYDFSNLTIWQADLRTLTRRTNFSGSDLSKTTFTESFNISIRWQSARMVDGLLLPIQGEICLWQLSDGQLLMRWEAHTGSVRSLIFMPDSQMIASGGDEVVETVGCKDRSASRVAQS